MFLNKCCGNWEDPPPKLGKIPKQSRNLVFDGVQCESEVVAELSTLAIGNNYFETTLTNLCKDDFSLQIEKRHLLISAFSVPTFGKD